EKAPEMAPEALAPADAPTAFAAGQIEIGRHLVADREVRDVRSDRDDLAGNLVSENAWQGRGATTRTPMLHGQSGPARKHTRHRLAGSRHRIGQRFELHR